MTTATAYAPLVASTGRALKLNMQRLWLTGRLLPVGARVFVCHEFTSDERKPVEVVYTFALPRDAALRRFRVTGPDFSVRSELRPTDEALKLYEQGIEAGALSTLARQYGDGMVSLTVGNIRPGETVAVTLEIIAGVELHDDGLRFRFPFTLAPSYHAAARAMETGPGWGEIELPPDEFGDLILPRYASSADGLHQVGFELSVEMGAAIVEVASPSHSIRVQTEGPQSSRVLLSREADLPDRDLVLDVSAKSDRAALLSGAAGGKGCLAAVIPSRRFGETSAEARRVVILLDRSGSMRGVPIAQAKKAIEACLGALAPADLFGLVAFDDITETFRSSMVEASMDNRSAARQFLDSIDARGGTELAEGVTAAAELLGGEPGDILILTDGQVFGTENILETARAAGARLHCLGIGSASQDRFLSLLSGQTGGVCRFLTPKERVDLPAVELFAAVGRPLARDLTVTLDGIDGAAIEPAPPSFVFAGTPLLVFAGAPGPGQGSLQVAWQGNDAGIRLPFAIEENELGETLHLLQGAKLITDFESRYLPGGRRGAAAKREADRVAARLVRLSEEYGLASREMSLVAVVWRPGDRPGEVPETRVVPVGMPQDTLFESIFPSPPKGSVTHLCQMLDVTASRQAPPRAMAEEPEDLGVRLAAMLEDDGGMPGDTGEFRIANSLAALLFFLQEGSTRRRGPFRPHVERLLDFLQTQPLDQPYAATVQALLPRLEAGKAPRGDWRRYAKVLASRGHVHLTAFWEALRVV